MKTRSRTARRVQDSGDVGLLRQYPAGGAGDARRPVLRTPAFRVPPGPAPATRRCPQCPTGTSATQTPSGAARGAALARMAARRRTEVSYRRGGPRAAGDHRGARLGEGTPRSVGEEAARVLLRARRGLEEGEPQAALPAAAGGGPRRLETPVSLTSAGTPVGDPGAPRAHRMRATQKSPGVLRDTQRDVLPLETRRVERPAAGDLRAGAEGRASSHAPQS